MTISKNLLVINNNHPGTTSGVVVVGVTAGGVTGGNGYIRDRGSSGGYSRGGGGGVSRGSERRRYLEYEYVCSEEDAGLGKDAAQTSPVHIHQGQQDKHIVGTNNYNQELAMGRQRSILTENPHQLLNDFSGTGVPIGDNKEWVNFGRVIGQYLDQGTGALVDTTKGIIHYNSSGGAHIVPAHPTGIRR